MAELPVTWDKHIIEEQSVTRDPPLTPRQELYIKYASQAARHQYRAAAGGLLVFGLQLDQMTVHGLRELFGPFSWIFVPVAVAYALHHLSEATRASQRAAGAMIGIPKKTLDARLP